MKIILSFIFSLSFLITSAIAQQNSYGNNKTKYINAEVKQADPLQIVKNTDPSLQKKEKIEVKQAESSQIITVTDEHFLKPKNRVVNAPKKE